MRQTIVIPRTDEYTDLKETGAPEPEHATGFVVLIQRGSLPVDLLGPYATRADAEDEVRDLMLNGQEGAIIVLPMFAGWARATFSPAGA